MHRRLPLLLVLPFTLGAQSAPAPAAASTPTPAPTSAPLPEGVRELPGGACSGPQPDDAQFSQLKRHGTRAVINLRRPEEHDFMAEEHAAQAAGLRYFTIPVDGANPLDSQVAYFLKLAADPANQPLYFHCHSGNRAGAFWIVKRMLQDGWDEARAVAEAESIGMRSPPLKAFALDYVKRHPPAPASSPASAPARSAP